MKFCLNCNMGEPLPHDQRIGQMIYNMLRKDLNNSSDELDEKIIVADKLFNISDHDLKMIFFDKLWCNKCKGEKMIP